MILILKHQKKIILFRKYKQKQKLIVLLIQEEIQSSLKIYIHQLSKNLKQKKDFVSNF
jgi:hypothetical protein